MIRNLGRWVLQLLSPRLSGHAPAADGARSLPDDLRLPLALVPLPLNDPPPARLFTYSCTCRKSGVSGVPECMWYWDGGERSVVGVGFVSRISVHRAASTVGRRMRTRLASPTMVTIVELGARRCPSHPSPAHCVIYDVRHV